MNAIPPRIAVIGAGAVGGSFAADMARNGRDVTVIDQWPAHVDAIRANGITVRLPDGTQEVSAVPALHLCDVATIRKPFDIVFVGVKAYDSVWAAQLLVPLLSDSSVVVGLQNGMTIDDYRPIVGGERVVGAVLGFAGNVSQPGLIDRQVSREKTWLTVGTLDGRRTRRLEQVAEILSGSGSTEVSTDIRASKWMKLLANVPEMLPSAIVGLPLLGAAALPRLRPIMEAAGKEAHRLALDLGIQMLPIFGDIDDGKITSDSYSTELFNAVLTTYSLPDTRVAVLQDWLKGRRAELDAFSGYIVKLREELGGSAPVNASLLAVAKRIESGELEPGVSNVAMIEELLADGTEGA